MDFVFNHLEIIVVALTLPACMTFVILSDAFTRKPVRRYEVTIFLSFVLGFWLVNVKSSSEDLLYWVGTGVLIFAIFLMFFKKRLADTAARQEQRIIEEGIPESARRQTRDIFTDKIVSFICDFITGGRRSR